MYKGKRHCCKSTERIKKLYTFAGVFSGIMGIFTFMVMIAFAAPEEQGAANNTLMREELQGGDVSGNEISDMENITQEPYLPLIIVDAGHGGEDDGCVEREVKEKDINLQVELANSYQADAYVSIHQNTYEGSDKSVSGIETWYDGADETRTMYLTFDDGPSAENTDKVLDVLKEKNVKATFFLIGEYVEKYPEVAKRIVAEGHTIGIHCYRHDYGVIYESKESFLADFQKAYDIIYEVTGVKTKLFRFPGGSVNSYNQNVCREIIEEMTKRGFIYFDWNASLEDAAGKYEPEQLIENARYTTLERKRVVMLAHDRVLNTALCLDQLIDQFPEYRMEVLSDKVEPVQFRLPCN